MIARLSVIGMLLVVSSAALAQPVQAAPASKARVHSSLGFSFLPPRGPAWSEELDRTLVRYSKTTDPKEVTFFAQALQLNCMPSVPGKYALVAFVREKKDQWGDDGRFKPLSSSFVPDPALATCVRYRMSVRDHDARNLGRHPFLLLHVVGRYCTHPQHPRNAVDLAYSIRHVPGYDAGPLEAEGKAFLDSLVLGQPPAGAGVMEADTPPCEF